MDFWTLSGFRVSPTGTGSGSGSGSGVLTILLKQPAKFLFLHSLYTKQKTKTTVFFADVCPKKFEIFGFDWDEKNPINPNPEIVHENFYCIIFLCTVFLVEILSL